MNRIGTVSAIAALTMMLGIVPVLSQTTLYPQPAPVNSYLGEFRRNLSAAAAWAEDWKCTNGAIFDNSTERQNIHDLRRQDFNSLSSPTETPP